MIKWEKIDEMIYELGEIIDKLSKSEAKFIDEMNSRRDTISRIPCAQAGKIQRLWENYHD